MLPLELPDDEDPDEPPPSLVLDFGSVDDDVIDPYSRFPHRLDEREHFVRLADAQLDADRLPARQIAQLRRPFE